jgi:predicted DNA-binding protein (UPF0251 family)
MPVHRFEELEAFQRAYEVSLEVHRCSLKMPQVEQYALADQLRRARKSICANLAEGFGKLRPIQSGVQAFYSNEHWVSRRDARLDSILFRFGIYR